MISRVSYCSLRMREYIDLPVELGMRFLRGKGESGGVSSEGVLRFAPTFPSRLEGVESRLVKPAAQNWKRRESGTDARVGTRTYQVIRDHV